MSYFNLFRWSFGVLLYEIATLGRQYLDISRFPVSFMTIVLYNCSLCSLAENPYVVYNYQKKNFTITRKKFKPCDVGFFTYIG